MLVSKSGICLKVLKEECSSHLDKDMDVEGKNVEKRS